MARGITADLRRNRNLRTHQTGMDNRYYHIFTTFSVLVKRCFSQFFGKFTYACGYYVHSYMF